jgi:hypothetical protein
MHFQTARVSLLIHSSPTLLPNLLSSSGVGSTKSV